MSVNKVLLLGMLGKNPELRHTNTGTAVTSFSIATNERWTDKSGKRNERTEWHSIIVWGAQAEACAKHLSKGSQVFIEGRVQTRQWTDKQGSVRYSTEIHANDVRFLNTKKPVGDDDVRHEEGAQLPAEAEFADGDLPF